MEKVNEMPVGIRPTFILLLTCLVGAVILYPLGRLGAWIEDFRFQFEHSGSRKFTFLRHVTPGRLRQKIFLPPLGPYDWA